MALAIFQYTSDPGPAVLVEGVPGKRVRVLRFVAAPDSAGYVQLRSDPLGAGTALTARLYVPGGSPLQLKLRRRAAVTGGVGESFGMLSQSSNPLMKMGLMLWYELVD